MLSTEALRQTVLRQAQTLQDKYETAFHLLLSVLAGVGAGLGAVVFRKLIDSFHWLFFDGLGGALSGMGDARVILLPAAGGLLVGPIIYFLAREAKGHGVPEVMLAVETQGGRIRPRVAVVKSLASALCIGSGGSVGREGPIVQIGSALGSTLGQLLRLPPNTVRLLVASGAAGGISATFNAPIAGVFFALEIILRRFNMRNFSIVVLSSVIADVIARSFLGNRPSFAIPPYAMESPAEIPFYALLGIISALAGLAFIIILYRTEDIFDALRLPDYTKPVIGGLGVGALGLWYSDLFGVGYDGINSVLAEDRVFLAMLALVGLKIAATSLTIGSGGSGGVFAPSLFIGAMLGGVYGSVVHTLFPGFTASSGAYATVGMGAVFAGAARAPITSIIILFEMTRDYNIILPLMTATVISTTVAHFLYRETIYTVKLKRRGIDIQERQEESILRTITVAQAMSRNFQTVSEEATVEELAQLFSSNGQQALPVMGHDDRLVGIVTLSDMERVVGQDLAKLKVKDIATANVVKAYPDQTLHETMHHLSDQGLRQLPVVSRHDPGRLLGMLCRSDIISAYSRASAAQPQRQEAPLASTAIGVYDAKLVEAKLGEDSPLVGKCLREIALPADSVVVYILREGHTVIPRGDVALQAGDHITVVTLPSALSAVEELLGVSTQRQQG